MKGVLQRHPFAVEARFERCCALTFAVPVESVARRLPPPLVPDAFEGRWGFLAVAVVQTRALRPAGWPVWAGQDFLLVGYRLFARYRSGSGRNLRGLFILRSETDRRRMAWLGNLFTGYRYVHSDLAITTDRTGWGVDAPAGGLRIRIDPGAGEPVALPDGSPFRDWREARRFSGPMPFTFSVAEAGREVVIVEGVHPEWNPRPVRVLEHRVPFLEAQGFGGAVLANAFEVGQVAYRWKRGRVERRLESPVEMGGDVTGA